MSEYLCLELALLSLHCRGLRALPVANTTPYLFFYGNTEFAL